MLPYKLACLISLSYLGCLLLCQLDRAIKCPAVWLKVIPGSVSEVFLNAISIFIFTLSKNRLTASVGVNLVQSDEVPNRTRRQRKGELSLFMIAFKLGHQPSDLDWFLHHGFFWFSGLQTGAGSAPPPLLDLQLADGRFWGISASIMVGVNSLLLYVHFLLICFSREF